jgi:hypothetical protein
MVQTSKFTRTGVFRASFLEKYNILRVVWFTDLGERNKFTEI